MARDTEIGSAPSSLERLKALDRLPDIASQLEEAKQLCNHSARADMICKWLLERLKSKKGMRDSPEAWETLLSALRLLSPQRVATLLSSHSFLGLCRLALEDEAESKNEDLFLALVRVLNYLTDVSAGPQGTPLKAVLCLPALEAACFLNIWIRFALTLDDIAFLDNGIGNDFFRPGIEIWNFRKRHIDENELFARNCLLSTSRLMPIISHYEHPSMHKRKREIDESSRHSYKQVLESMLARHVFVPARAAFFKARDVTGSKIKRQIGSEDPKFVLRSMFEPLREASPRTEGLGGGQLTILLDVAIRCTPMITPQQWMREKPWIDTVFQTLTECSGGADRREEIPRALKAMLSLIKERQAPLSTAVLNDLIEFYSGLGSGKEVDWTLTSLILEIDGDVFSEDNKAAILFSELTRVMGVLNETSNTGLEFQESPIQTINTGEELLDFFRVQIIAPVMRAFANQRKLGTFVDMWAAQISNDKYQNTPLVWTGLEAYLAPLLEGSLTQSQILAIFDHYCASIKTISNNTASDDERPLPSTSRASIVILDTIHNGIGSEALTDALHERSGELLQSMLGSRATESSQSSSEDPRPFPFPMESQTWALMTKAFELWFPAWAMAQADATVVAMKGTEIIRSNAFAVATQKTSNLNPSTQHAAEAFVVCVCSHLLPYDQYDDLGEQIMQMPRSLCFERMSFLSKVAMDLEERNAFLQYTRLVPELLLVEEHSTSVHPHSLFPRKFCESSLPVENASQIESARALATVILQRGTPVQVEDLVEWLLARILGQILSYDHMCGINEFDDKVNQGNEIGTLKVLSGLSPESFTRLHREKIVDAICRRQQADEASPTAEDIQGWRLAVLVKFMRLPNATSKLAVDSEELWRLIDSTRPDVYNDERHLLLLEEMMVLLSNHLLATQDQERSRTMLVNLSHWIKERIEFLCSPSGLYDCNEILVAVNTLIVQLESGAKENLKSMYVHRDAELIQRLLEVCLKWLSSCTASMLELNVKGSLEPALNMLLSMPESLVQLSRTDTDAWSEPLSQLLQSCMDFLESNDLDQYDDSQLSQFKDVLVKCFQLLLKISKDGDAIGLSVLAPRIVGLHLTASTRQRFLASFRLFVERMPQNHYIELLDDLFDLRDESGTTSASILPLLEVCAARPSQNDAGLGQSHLLKLLSALLTMITDDRDVLTQKKAMGCVATALKGNSSLVSQYAIELTLQTLYKVLNGPSKTQVLYFDICQVTSTILLQYRSRLHGRLHLVVQVYQALLSRLFAKAGTGRARDDQGRKPTVKHAQAFSKLLTLLCEPPQFKRSSNSSSLVDESRKEQAYVGKSVQYILHHYCSQILAGQLEPGMRETITPGLWSMIEAMEMSEAEGIKSLSAAMNNSERAVLRSVYEDWRRFGKWRGA